MKLVLFALAVLIGVILYLIKVKNTCVSFERNIEKKSKAVKRAEQNMRKSQREAVGMAQRMSKNVAKANKLREDGEFTGDDIKAVGSPRGHIDDTEIGTMTALHLREKFLAAQSALDDVITAYNDYICVFPRSIFAWILGYKTIELVSEEDLQSAIDGENAPENDFSEAWE